MLEDDLATMSRENPDHAKLIAEITVAWSVLDTSMSILLSRVLGVWGPIGSAVFFTITSNKVRREMILNAARARFAEEGDVKAVERFLKRAQRASAKRNKLMHGIWHMSPGPGVSAYMTIKGADSEWVHVTTKDLRDTLRQIVQLAKDLDHYLWDEEHWQTLPEKSALSIPPQEE